MAQDNELSIDEILVILAQDDCYDYRNKLVELAPTIAKMLIELKEHRTNCWREKLKLYKQIKEISK